MRVLLGAVRDMTTADRQAMWKEMMRMCQPESEAEPLMSNPTSTAAPGSHNNRATDKQSPGGGEGLHHRTNSLNPQYSSAGGGDPHHTTRNEPRTPGIRNHAHPTPDHPAESPQRSLPDLSSIGHESPSRQQLAEPPITTNGVQVIMAHTPDPSGKPKSSGQPRAAQPPQSSRPTRTM